MRRRPLTVTAVALVYIAAGAIGFAYHFPELFTGVFPALWTEAVRLAAIAAGLFLLRGRAWARWLALAWMGFHVVLSALHTLPEFAFHAASFALIAWLLLRSASSRYFRPDLAQ